MRSKNCRRDDRDPQRAQSNQLPSLEIHTRLGVLADFGRDVNHADRPGSFHRIGLKRGEDILYRLRTFQRPGIQNVKFSSSGRCNINTGHDVTCNLKHQECRALRHFGVTQEGEAGCHELVARLNGSNRVLCARSGIGVRVVIYENVLVRGKYIERCTGVGTRT